MASNTQRYYKNRLYLHEDKTLDWQELSYSDSTCEQPAYAVVFKGTYNLSVVPDDHLYGMDLQFAELEAYPLTTDGQALLEAERFCGVARWETGVPLDISRLQDAPCRSFGVLPVLNWNLVSIIPGSRLQFASPVTPDNIRPTRVQGDDPALIFRPASGRSRF